VLYFAVPTKYNMTLRIGRAIFAVLIGLSVAMLPAATAFAAHVATATEMSAAEAMPDCDHHQHHHNAPSDKTQKTAGDCACMAACALTCFSFTAPGFSGITFSSPASTALKPVRTVTNVSSRMGSPPYRPPRS
jgi:uncharacterized protein involved in copper resistance